MKNILLIITLAGFAFTIFAQEAADKKVQAGLTIGYGMNFQKMGTKLLESDGIGSDLTIGANVNWSLTETIGFFTGLEFDFESLKYKTPPSDQVFYYYKEDDNTLVEFGDPSSDPTLHQNDNIYQMTRRKQKPVYLTIPTMLSFRTKFIGYFRYFGKFGLRTSVLLSNKITDEGFNYPVSGAFNDDDNKDMTAKNEMFPVKSAVGLAGGAEWNFVGSTSLVGEIGYYYGFTPLYNDRKTEKTYLQSTGSNDNPPVFSNKANQSQLMFKLSILF